MQSTSFKKLIIFAVFFLISTAVVPALAADRPARVLILPFKMNTPQNTVYLQQGILDMLTSRLEWQGRVEVLSKAESRAVFDRSGGNFNEDKARSVGQKLGADFVIYGSVTMVGKNLSLDGALIDVKGDQSPVSISIMGQGLDSVIPKINEFANEINATVFRRGPETAGRAPRPAPDQEDNEPVPAHRRHPDNLLSGYEGRRLSPLNPNFIAAVGADEREGQFWRSPSVPIAIIGLDVADVDGDGLNEIVYTSTNSIYVARMEGNRMIKMGQYNVDAADRIVSLDIFDLNSNGRPEIYVSVQNKQKARSLILEVRNNKLEPIGDRVPWYFRVVNLPVGRTMVGQKSAIGEMVSGPIHTLGLSDGQIVSKDKLSLPRGANVFNFALARLDQSPKNYVVVIDDDDDLLLYSRGGEELFKSVEAFGATMNYLEKPYGVMSSVGGERRQDGPEKYYVPSRILVADLNEDGISEIILARSEKSELSGWMHRFRKVKRATIVSLKYDSLAMRENWRSRPLPGALSDYRIADFDNNGKMDLIASVTLEVGEGGLEKSRSTIVAYELATPSEMREAEKKWENN